MTIIRLISLAPMLGDKVPFEFSLNAVVGFAARPPTPFLLQSQTATFAPSFTRTVTV